MDSIKPASYFYAAAASVVITSSAFWASSEIKKTFKAPPKVENIDFMNPKVVYNGKIRDTLEIKPSPRILKWQAALDSIKRIGEAKLEYLKTNKNALDSALSAEKITRGISTDDIYMPEMKNQINPLLSPDLAPSERIISSKNRMDSIKKIGLAKEAYLKAYRATQDSLKLAKNSFKKF